ncbi:sugar nucleotide-binding protein, partial [Bacillus cereus]|uniref:sugar nucleotide-binding protein n=1 Tax=Bacillus cereus TaxID=1396 RepID=UPI0027E55687
MAGEKYVIESGAFSYIVRTSWVFGEYGKNFVFTMQALGRKLSELSVVDDQHGRPTWTRSLAEFMLYLVTTSADEGIYNFSNDGDTTWFGFAEEILKDSDVELTPVSSEKFKTKAQRPNNSVLSLEKAKST